MDEKIVSIKKVFKIIDSCINQEQLKTCEKLADYYTEIAKSKGVINPSLIKEVLYIHINEKREELGMAQKFNGLIRRKKIKITEPELELIENFS
jgi:hypothetical protein